MIQQHMIACRVTHAVLQRHAGQLHSDLTGMVCDFAFGYWLRRAGENRCGELDVIRRALGTDTLMVVELAAEELKEQRRECVSHGGIGVGGSSAATAADASSSSTTTSATATTPSVTTQTEPPKTQSSCPASLSSRSSSRSSRHSSSSSAHKMTKVHHRKR